jgi:hypothetical protein
MGCLVWPAGAEGIITRISDLARDSEDLYPIEGLAVEGHRFYSVPPLRGLGALESAWGGNFFMNHLSAST